MEPKQPNYLAQPTPTIITILDMSNMCLNGVYAKKTKFFFGIFVWHVVYIYFIDVGHRSKKCRSKEKI
jgi:hypothetical protein